MLLVSEVMWEVALESMSQSVDYGGVSIIILKALAREC